MHAHADNFSYSSCRDDEHVEPEVAVEFLGKHCKWAVVTLGCNGSIAKHGKEVGEVLC